MPSRQRPGAARLPRGRFGRGAFGRVGALRMSVGAQWTFRYTVAMLVTLSVFAGYVYTRVERHLMGNAKLLLELQLTELRDAVEQHPNHPQLWRAYVQQHVQAADPELRLGLRILRRDGAPLVAAGSLAAFELPIPPAVRSGRKNRVVDEVDLGERDPFLAVSAAGGAGFLQAAVCTGVFARSAAHIRYVMLLGLGPMLILTAGLGWWLSRGVLRPVAKMTRAARRISTTHLDEQVPVSGSGDELDELAETLNQMVARIRRGVKRTRRFAVDVAHQLRTPLAGVRSQIEVTLAQTRSSQEYRHVLQDVLGQVEQLGETVQGMLRLTDSESGIDAKHRVRIELEALLSDVLSFFAPLGEERGVAIQVQDIPGVELEGDPTWLRELFGNVLQNALQYTPAGGQVILEGRIEGESVSVRVRDSGPGIAARDRERIFESFQRGEAGARRSGAGLGLALALEIARAHGGTIEVDAEGAAGPGSVFAVRLPLAPTG